MPDEPEITVTLTFPRLIAERLAALDDPERAGAPLEERVTTVLDVLADHAQQGVVRRGAWERGWLLQAFGYDWLDHMEPDPEGPHHDRPRLRG